MPLIAIDNGHGLNTPGKQTPLFPDGTIIKEWEFNYPTAKKLGALLEAHGLKVLYVSPTEEDTPLATRTKLANQAKTDLFVSIHYNGYKGVWGSHGGIETYHYPGSTKGKALAEVIQEQLIKSTRWRDRGVKTANFHVLRESQMPAVLVECGFMDNPEEAAMMLEESHQQRCAEAICRGILTYLGISPEKDQTTPHITTPNNPTDTPWAIPQGVGHLSSLKEKGIILNPDYWRDKLLDPMPAWAVLSLIDRITEKENVE